MSHPAFRLTAAAFGAALFTVSLSASAADTSPDTTLGAVTVVGNWLENPNAAKVLEHPGARTIVDRETIEESGATNVRGCAACPACRCRTATARAAATSR